MHSTSFLYTVVRRGYMPEEQQVLDPAVQRMINDKIKPNECIHGWATVPTDDLVVFLCDNDLEQSIQPIAKKIGRSLGRGRTLVFAFQGGKWSLVGAGFWGGGVERALQF